MTIEQNPQYSVYPGCETSAINQLIRSQLGGGNYCRWISVIRKEYAIGYDQVSQTLQSIKELGLVDDKYFPIEQWTMKKRLKDLPKEITERAFKVDMDYQNVPFNIVNTVLKYEPLISVIPVFDSFRNVGKDGIVRGMKFENHSRHCMLALKKIIKDDLMVYDYLNNYGYDYGDNGHYYFPVGYIHHWRDESLFYTCNVKKI